MTMLRPRALPNAAFDETNTRYCMPYENGIACYRGLFEADGKWRGDLVGVALNETDASRFLQGALVTLHQP